MNSDLSKVSHKLARRTVYGMVLSLSLISVPGAARSSNVPDLSSAGQIMVAVDQRYDGDTRKQEGNLILFDKNKNRRVRGVRERMKTYNGGERVITQITSPPEVSGTTILSYDWDEQNRDDETWLYLPQLRKVKRLAAADKSAYFLGSDFTYADLTGLEVSDYDYAFADDNGKEPGQWTIIALPRRDIEKSVIEETGYKKIKYWIDKERLVTLKAQYWLDEGNRIKYFSAMDYTLIDNIWTAQKLQMVLTQGGQMLHASLYELTDVTFNEPLADQLFTTYAMERPVN